MSKEVVETIFGLAQLDPSVRTLLTDPNLPMEKLKKFLGSYDLSGPEKSAFLAAPKTEELKDVAVFVRQQLGYDKGENEN